MSFTPRNKLGTAISGTLTIIVVLGLIGWGSHAAPAPGVVQPRNPSVVQDHFRANAQAAIIPAVGAAFAPGYTYQPVSAWYKSKHWWKRNAPIVGGAGGGALVGGVIGGGAGAVVGGALGGGGGYLYKRHREHEYRERNYNNYYYYNHHH